MRAKKNSALHRLSGGLTAQLANVQSASRVTGLQPQKLDGRRQRTLAFWASNDASRRLPGHRRGVAVRCSFAQGVHRK